MRNRSLAIRPGDMYGRKNEMGITEIIIELYCIIKVIPVCSLPYPVICGKLTE
jgi:hypothetical protein